MNTIELTSLASSVDEVLAPAAQLLPLNGETAQPAPSSDWSAPRYLDETLMADFLLG